MARAKIKRGSTSVDMTPMCDVAFLLLTFFILAAQFKPQEAVDVTPPSSVSNKVAPEKDFLNVTISKDNKVFLNMDPKIKGDVLDELGKERNMSFSAQDKKNFENSDFIGVPLSQLKQFIALSPEQLKATVKSLPGIPVDSTNNELTAWISAAINARMGEQLNFLIKGDDAVKYPKFKAVIDAFKANDQYKYNLVTNSKQVPEGSELYKKNLMEQRSGKKE
ncbi:MAG TPA: biopolymer transporter ExbD [Hanamia sp.]|jgi:biopolymer transport protein ExbD|nr:biopolymer transporter ExbD [Hanamia sp.]